MEIMLSKNDVNNIKALLYEANNMAKSYRKKGLDISYKKDRSPVTNADIAISEFLVSELAKISPDTQIISEESAYMPTQDPFWLIDPIDGTRGYINGDNLYTVNIGLISGDKPLYGFITIPETDMLYYTETPDTLKIERDGLEVTPSKNDKLKAVISCDLDKKIAMEIMAQHGISEYEHLPCSAKFCLIASGEADLYPRYGENMEWDTAAGGALIQASGGVMLHLDGKVFSYGKENLVNKGFIAYSKRLKDIRHNE